MRERFEVLLAAKFDQPESLEEMSFYLHDSRLEPFFVERQQTGFDIGIRRQYEEDASMRRQKASTGSGEVGHEEMMAAAPKRAVSY